MNVVLLWLVNEKGELLLARRAAGVDMDSGVWAVSLSGGIEEGESAPHTAIREAKEELDLDLDEKELNHLYETSLNHANGKVLNFSVYWAPVKATINNTLTLDPEEVSEVVWMSIPTLHDLLKNNPSEVIASDNHEFWEDLLQNLSTITNVFTLNAA